MLDLDGYAAFGTRTGDRLLMHDAWYPAYAFLMAMK